jgi:small subunit ribosomal protein S7
MYLLKQKKFLILKYLKLFLKQGKKETNERMLRLGFASIKKLKKVNPILIFLDAVNKARPFCEIRSLRVKGSIKRIPIEIKENRQKTLAMRWLILNMFNRTEKTLVECLTKEFLDTILLQSKTIKMRDDLHKIVETNKTFTQFKN